MQRVSLKELVKENLCLAESLSSDENSNNKILELLESAGMGINVQKETFELLATMLSKLSSLPDLLFKLAVINDDNAQYEDAIFLYRLANMLRPDPRSINNIAVIYANSNVTEARKILSYGIEQFPEDTTLRENFNLL